jgi:hypothetical protein
MVGGGEPVLDGCMVLLIILGGNGCMCAWRVMVVLKEHPQLRILGVLNINIYLEIVLEPWKEIRTT